MSDKEESSLAGTKRKIDEEDAATTTAKPDDSCAICLESHALLPEHGCGRCNNESWRICRTCHDILLSRLCPVCNGPYAHLPLYAVQHLPQFENPMPKRVFTDQSESLNYLARLFITTDDSFLFNSNCGVLVPSEKMIYFSLPTGEDKYIITSLPVADESMDGLDIYKFTSSTWENLEDHSEEGDEEEGAKTIEVPRKSARAFLMRCLLKTGAMLMTHTTPERVNDMVSVAVSEAGESISSLPLTYYNSHFTDEKIGSGDWIFRQLLIVLFPL